MSFKKFVKKLLIAKRFRKERHSDAAPAIEPVLADKVENNPPAPEPLIDPTPSPAEPVEPVEEITKPYEPVEQTSLSASLFPELLSYIFELGLGPDDDSLYLLAITHVCQHWRRVAIAHTALWCTINYQSNPQLVKTWLIRSGNRPLIVEFDSIRGTDSPVSNMWVMLQHSSRWEQVHLRIRDHNTRGPLVEVAEVNDLSSVQIMSLVSEDPYTIYRLKSLAPLPQLHSLCLRAMFPINLDVIVPTLSHLRLGGRSLKGFHEWSQLLQLCERLETLELDHLMVSPFDEIQGDELSWTSYELPRLQSFSIQHLWPEDARFFLATVRAPALKSFRISIAGYPSMTESSGADFGTMLSHCRQTIQHFQIEGDEHGAGMLLKIGDAWLTTRNYLPNLQKITLVLDWFNPGSMFNVLMCLTMFSNVKEIVIGGREKMSAEFMNNFVNWSNINVHPQQDVPWGSVWDWKDMGQKD